MAGVRPRMQAARTGRPERDAYERWVREHHAEVWRAARRILRDDALASDVAQRVYLRALEHGLELAPGESAERLLCWMACKESLTELRGRRRRAAHEERAAMRDEDPEPGPAERSSAADARAWLARELGSLAEELRTVLVLRYQQGLSLREIGALLELAESSVHERAQRGLEKLRQRAERAGLAAVLVDLGGELRACEPAAAPPLALAPSLLKGTTAASASAWLVPLCALFVAAVSVGAWWSNRNPGPRSTGTASADLARASAAPTTEVPAASDAELSPRAARAEVVAAEQVAPAAASAAAAPPAIAAHVRTVATGRIVDPDRVPLAGIGLSFDPLFQKDLAKDLLKSVRATTAFDGRFRVELPVGPVFALHVEHHARGTVERHVRTDDRSEFDFGDVEVGARSAEIYGEWTLSVRVRDMAGAPLDGIEVCVVPVDLKPQVSAHQWQVATDALGRAEIGGDRRGEFEVWTNSLAAGYQPERAVRTLERGAHELQFELRASRSLTGRLVTPNGEAFDGGLLSFEQPDFHTRGIAAPDKATGAFVLEGISNGRLFLLGGGGTYSAFEVHYDRPPNEPLVLELKREDDPRDVGVHLGELHGRCVDASGRPVPIAGGAVSAVRLPASASGDFWADIAGSLRGYSSPSARGRGGAPAPSAEFHSVGLDPGRYALVATADGYANAYAGPFTIDAVGASSATIHNGIELVFEKPWKLVAEFERGPAEPERGEGLWLASGDDQPAPLVGSVVGDTIEWNGLHPRIPYRVVLQGAQRTLCKSALVGASGSDREVVKFAGWPDRP